MVGFDSRHPYSAFRALTAGRAMARRLSEGIEALGWSAMIRATGWGSWNFFSQAREVVASEIEPARQRNFMLQEW